MAKCPLTEVVQTPGLLIHSYSYSALADLCQMFHPCGQAFSSGHCSGIVDLNRHGI